MHGCIRPSAAALSLAPPAHLAQSALSKHTTQVDCEDTRRAESSVCSSYTLCANSALWHSRTLHPYPASTFNPRSPFTHELSSISGPEPLSDRRPACFVRATRIATADHVLDGSIHWPRMTIPCGHTGSICRATRCRKIALPLGYAVGLQTATDPSSSSSASANTFRCFECLRVLNADQFPYPAPSVLPFLIGVSVCAACTKTGSRFLKTRLQFEQRMKLPIDSSDEEDESEEEDDDEVEEDENGKDKEVGDNVFDAEDEEFESEDEELLAMRTMIMRTVYPAPLNPGDYVHGLTWSTDQAGTAVAPIAAGNDATLLELLRIRDSQCAPLRPSIGPAYARVLTQPLEQRHRNPWVHVRCVFIPADPYVEPFELVMPQCVAASYEGLQVLLSRRTDISPSPELRDASNLFRWDRVDGDRKLQLIHDGGFSEETRQIINRPASLLMALCTGGFAPLLGDVLLRHAVDVPDAASASAKKRTKKKQINLVQWVIDLPFSDFEGMVREQRFFYFERSLKMLTSIGFNNIQRHAAILSGLPFLGPLPWKLGGDVDPFILVQLGELAEASLLRPFVGAVFDALQSIPKSEAGDLRNRMVCFYFVLDSDCAVQRMLYALSGFGEPSNVLSKLTAHVQSAVGSKCSQLDVITYQGDRHYFDHPEALLGGVHPHEVKMPVALSLFARAIETFLWLPPPTKPGAPPAVIPEQAIHRLQAHFQWTLSESTRIKRLVDLMRHADVTTAYASWQAAHKNNLAAYGDRAEYVRGSTPAFLIHTFFWHRAKHHLRPSPSTDLAAAVAGLPETLSEYNCATSLHSSQQDLLKKRASEADQIYDDLSHLYARCDVVGPYKLGCLLSRCAESNLVDYLLASKANRSVLWQKGTHVAFSMTRQSQPRIRPPCIVCEETFFYQAMKLRERIIFRRSKLRATPWTQRTFTSWKQVFNPQAGLQYPLSEEAQFQRAIAESLEHASSSGDSSVATRRLVGRAAALHMQLLPQHDCVIRSDGNCLLDSANYLLWRLQAPSDLLTPDVYSWVQQRRTQQATVLRAVLTQWLTNNRNFMLKDDNGADHATLEELRFRSDEAWDAMCTRLAQPNEYLETPVLQALAVHTQRDVVIVLDGAPRTLPDGTQVESPAHATFYASGSGAVPSALLPPLILANWHPMHFVPCTPT